jgi:hypothetical protein
VLPEKYQKRSFLRFATPINLPRLIDEYHSIPEDIWQASYWGNIHCSVGMLLLRGGQSGTEKDFFSDSVFDNSVLEQLPYIKSLIDPDGPFGGAEYAFIFRMEPSGLTQAHRDMIEKWEDMFRIHVPIESNKRAKLISDGYAQHFSPGYAWSFDNSSWHGVVNGTNERIHLIFDVKLNDVLVEQLDRATFEKGEKRDDLVRKIESEKKSRQSYPGDLFISDAIARLRGQGLSDAQIADAFNARKFPTKRYYIRNQRQQPTSWTAEMISDVSLE